MCQNNNTATPSEATVSDVAGSDVNSDMSAKIDPTEHETIGGRNKEERRGKEHTRKTMALLFVLGFFALLFLCFAYAIKTDATLAELKDALVAIIGALSGIFGFIVGYYYKTSQENP